jgi:hypothetical protein
MPDYQLYENLSIVLERHELVTKFEGSPLDEPVSVGVFAFDV